MSEPWPAYNWTHHLANQPTAGQIITYMATNGQALRLRETWLKYQLVLTYSQWWFHPNPETAAAWDQIRLLYEQSLPTP